MKKIYFVVSSTPTSMGKMIRKITHYPYNHISFATHKDLSDLVSFSRHYYHTPLYGGFVSECYEGLVIQNEISKIKVYEFEIEDGEFQKIQEMLEDMKQHIDEYQYNSLNAFFHPFHIKMQIQNCFTCEEFCSFIMMKTGIYEEQLSIPKFCALFENSCIYEGYLDEYDHAIPHSDTYKMKLSWLTKIKLTSRHFIRLFARL